MSMTEADLQHPLTTELFDRTPEQRAERARVGATLRRDDVTIRGEKLEGRINETMLARFYGDVTDAIDERRTQLIGKLVNSTPGVDESTVRLVAVNEVAVELRTLHAALPLPGLERLAGEVK